MDVIEQVFKSGDVWVVGLGLLFIIMAIVIGIFKQYLLLAVVHTMFKKDFAKMDLEYVCKYHGIFFGVFGIFVILSLFICRYLNIMNYFHYFMPIAIIAFLVFLLLYFNVIKKNRVYMKK